VDTNAEDHAPDALRYLLINLADPTIDGWLLPGDDVDVDGGPGEHPWARQQREDFEAVLEGVEDARGDFWPGWSPW
jgi:hypothetical protein